MSSCTIIDCLLPNSIIVPLACSPDIQLCTLKQNLWQEAKKYPLFSALGTADKYVFFGVTIESEQEEFWDESRKLCDLRGVIGKSIDDLESAKDEEIKRFRKEILSVVAEAVSTRQQQGMESLARYQHPPELEPSPHLPESVKTLLDNGVFDVKLWISSSKSFTVKVSWDIYPDGIISEALRLFISDLEDDKENSCSNIKGVAKYALKICGTNEYLLASRPVTQFKTIRRWISQGKTPQLSIVLRGKLYASLNKFSFSFPSQLERERSVDEPQSRNYSLWHPSMEGRLKIHILRAFNVSVRLNSKFFVRVGLFHGNQLLCPILETQPVTAPPRWGEWIQFELPIQEVPRAAKLCFSLCVKGQATEKRRKRMKEDDAMIGWGNVHLFDFEDRLIRGHILITLLIPPQNFDGLINPLGPSVDSGASSSDAMQLGVEFEQRFNQCVLFPDEKQMQDYAKYIIKLEKFSVNQEATEEELEKIQALCSICPGKEINEEEKEFLWKNRKTCFQIPDSLPRLLGLCEMEFKRLCQPIKTKLYLLLEDWPLVSPETALELLQLNYPDFKVREHAVMSLSKSLPDEKLSQYLLQLVHTLKHEAYLDSPLLRFLLLKSLTNKNLGYYFFWHLRSEVNLWPNALRALSILESFCRGLGPDLKTLSRHVEMIDKLGKLADYIRLDASKDRNKQLQNLLQESEYSSALQHLPSPLRPSLTLGRLRLADCKVLHSARRPIFLLWENADPMAGHFSLSHALIFKNGDDLRQDTLTLQVIGIMNHAWTSEGLDLRMTPYSCLATGVKTGIIEVVRNAKTVYSIQRRAKLGAIQVDSSQLYKWIKDNNPGKRLDQAIETFTRSCAGYCVATFVLGIGDRHPDNIMVNEEGQIFHIDFGHFLGNFKKKFGIQRERVPFVLTQDFLKVIAAGDDNPKSSLQFQRFQELCGKAYLALRKHSRLIMALFTLLISTGLPELQSMEDIAFLRKTLAVDACEEEALQYFQNQFHEAYGGAWTTKLDWFFHSVKHR
ncbi:Phosphatidylinositol 4,5-bisphosphate 3-kinase catalytic subunit alpha isoform [Armadillidium vulgare]|nr:Phosphatidylinositol 4,5-bisphosphate 3-kinase catalytic subunit alpha isoform [Armadillidium vulgare]